MKRINGFIDLDEYFENINVSKYDIKEGNNDTDYWLKINGTTYYFKYTQRPYVELICYEIANFLGINAVSYDLAIFRNFKGVISKSYRKENCNYVSGTTILKDYLKFKENINNLKEMGLQGKNYFLNMYLPRDINNLEVIWQAIEQRYNRMEKDIDIENIMYNLVLLFIFNTLTLQNDGLPHNWELEESKNGVCLVPIFDNEYCLALDDRENSFSNFNVSFNDSNKSNIDILESFLNISSKEYVSLFIEKFNSLTSEVFLELLNIVEDKIKDKIPENLRNEYIVAFNKNRENIDLLLSEIVQTKNGRN